jgi:hypothetical protein
LIEFACGALTVIGPIALFLYGFIRSVLLKPLAIAGLAARKFSCGRLSEDSPVLMRRIEQETVDLHPPVNPLVISGQHLALEDSVDTPAAVS